MRVVTTRGNRGKHNKTHTQTERGSLDFLFFIVFVEHNLIIIMIRIRSEAAGSAVRSSGHRGSIKGSSRRGEPSRGRLIWLVSGGASARRAAGAAGAYTLSAAASGSSQNRK